MFQVYFELIFYWIGINCNGNGRVCISCQFGIRVVVIFIDVIVGNFLSVRVNLWVVVVVVYFVWVVIFILVGVVVRCVKIQVEGFFMV